MPRWLLWTALAVAAWGVWAVMGKLVGSELSAAQTQALSTVGLLPVVLALARPKYLAAARTHPWGAAIAFVSGAVSCWGNVPFFRVLNEGDSTAVVAALTSLAPAVTTVLAVSLLGERLNAVQAGGLALAFAAMYLGTVSSEDWRVSPWLTAVLLPTAVWGLAGFLQKLGTNHMDGAAAACWCLLGFLAVSVGLVVAYPPAQPVPVRTWLVVFGLGFFLAFGNAVIVMAYAHGRAAVVAPLSGLFPLVSLPAAYLLLGETVTARQAAGIGLAVAAVAALAWESKQPETRH